MAIQVPAITRVLNSSTLNTSGTPSYNTTAWDFAGFDAANFIVAIGSIAGGGGFSILKLQESDTSGGTYTDVTSGNTSGLTIADTDDNKIVSILVRRTGRKRFLRMTLTTAAAAATVVDGVLAVGLSNTVNDPITIADFSVIVS